MAEIVLYRANGACSFVPHVLLTELSIPFTSFVLKWGLDGLEANDGSLSNADYRASVNQGGFVPMLKVADGRLIGEMPAVLTYIASLPNSRGLGGGDDPVDRAKVVEWLAWISGTLHGVAFGMLFRPARFTDDSDSHEKIRQRGKGLADAGFARINQRLEGRDFPVGEHETVVDYNLVIFWYWGREVGLSLEKYPHFAKLVQRMESKASLKAVAEMEGLKLYW